MTQCIANDIAMPNHPPRAERSDCKLPSPAEKDGFTMKLGRLTLMASAVVVSLGLICAAALYWRQDDVKRSLGLQSKPTQEVWDQFSCRVQLYLAKATSENVELAHLSWSDLWGLTRPGVPFHCAEGTSLGASLRFSSFAQDSDRTAGGQIFHERCVVCHGSNGAGGPHGPSLVRSSLVHGDSDLAMYTILKNGIAGTPMPPANLAPAKMLQVIAYVKALQARLPSQHNDDPQSHLAINVTDERLRAAGTRTDEWLMYSGAYNGRRYTQLDQITPANVAKLRVRWIRQFPGDDPASEATPLVVDGVILTAISASHVTALDAKTGKTIWDFNRRVPEGLSLCCGRPNRGLAIYGDTIFFDSLDGYLIAINADNGKVEWQTQVAPSSDGFTLTGAPLVVDHMVIVGVAGGEFGIRGFLAAFDVATGLRQWVFSTIPGPGEFGHDTWPGNTWRTGGGPTWNTGSYDPATDLLFWGVGNPGPVFGGNQRQGDNLFTDSVIALHAKTGKLAWYFQFTPHDEHDWDSAQIPVLADLPINGAVRKTICWGNRNGFYYVLDRVTGKFLAGAPYVPVNWTEGLDPTGRPIPSNLIDVSNAGRRTMPGVGGGTNWQNPSFDTVRNSFFIPATESATVFTELPEDEVAERKPDEYFLASGWAEIVSPKRSVIALDASTGRQRWEYKITPDAGDYGGLLATGGGVVFGTSGGEIFALDADTGHEAWHLSLGGGTRSGLISFTIDGQQVIIAMAGQAMIELGL